MTQKTLLTQILPGPNFFKPSIPGGLRIFRAFASLSFFFLWFLKLKVLCWLWRQQRHSRPSTKSEHDLHSPQSISPLLFSKVWGPACGINCVTAKHIDLESQRLAMTSGVRVTVLSTALDKSCQGGFLVAQLFFFPTLPPS